MTTAVSRVLVIAPHPDDETLGVGGTLASLASVGVETTVLTVSAHMPPLYPESMHKQTIAEARRAHAILGVGTSIFWDNPAVMLDQLPTADLNRAVYEVVRDVAPDVLFVPYHDRHIDHRIVFESAMVAARPVAAGQRLRMVAAYETLSASHWTVPGVEAPFVPNWWVSISGFTDKKQLAMRQYESQLQSTPGPRSLEALQALATFRGSQAGHAAAEAFVVIRLNAGPELLPSRSGRRGLEPEVGLPEEHGGASGRR